MKVYINLSKINFSATLGVWRFALNLIEAYRDMQNVSLIGVLPAESNTADIGANRQVFDKVIHVGEVGKEEGNVELLIHHFQLPVTGLRYIVIFHDFHVIDVSWKYSEPKKQIEEIEELLSAASAVVTHFPRTYFDLPKYFKGTPNAVFLTTSPTMHGMTKLGDGVLDLALYGVAVGDWVIFYPAQLQPHKNHISLFKAVAKLKKSIPSLKLICCGSEFREEYTELLKDCISELRADGYIKLVGYVTDDVLRGLYDRSNLVISPSLAEGGAYIAQEAIVNGKKVTISGTRSAIMHLKVMRATVPVFDPLDVQEICGAILKCHSTHIDNATAKSIIATWTWGGLAAQYHQVLSWVAGGSQPKLMPPLGPEELGFSLSGSITGYGKTVGQYNDI